MRASEGKGLGMFALRDFKKGEKILVERPVIYLSDDITNESDSLYDILPLVKSQFVLCMPTVQSAIECLSNFESSSPEMLTFGKEFGMGPMAYSRNCYSMEPD